MLRPCTFLATLIVSITCACSAAVDMALVEHAQFLLAAHDSAHVRQLVLVPAAGVILDTAVAPLLLLQSGERLAFAPELHRHYAETGATVSTLRVPLTTPINGTLRLRVCQALAGGTPSARDQATEEGNATLNCETISVPVYTRSRSSAGRI